uniref:Uncharacterized protein n=6 Tax=Cercopithecidae TaxID=9527 RepID=A0A2K5XNS1_MANLE|nr:unnamed protein product [Macaca fascicularis]
MTLILVGNKVSVDYWLPSSIHHTIHSLGHLSSVYSRLCTYKREPIRMCRVTK